MSVRYADERAKAGVIQQLTSLTVAEFETLAPLVQDAGSSGLPVREPIFSG